MPTDSITAAETVRRYRQRMRAQGLRSIQLWVPDTRSPRFAEECRRQSLLAAHQDKDSEIMEVLDAAAKEIDGWTP